MSETKEHSKRYGLMCPRKTPLSAPKAINVFGNDDDSEDEDGTDWVRKALKAEGEKNRAKKQTRLDIEKAMLEDPTVCQYDEVFDDMKRQEEQGKIKYKQVKKPKYIENLLKTAERRKREQEHRIERTVQKEREAEGAAFADKESFVTSAYRAKLEEFRKMEKEEENMDRLEAIGDVTKQQDMSGFYRHLFSQTVDAPTTEESSKPIESTAEFDAEDSRRSELSLDPNLEIASKRRKMSGKGLDKEKQPRQYRRRVSRESESEAEEAKVCEEAETASEENSRVAEEASECRDSAPTEERMKESSNESKNTSDDSIMANKINTIATKPDTQENTEESDSGLEEAKKKKVSIWEKRTVGPVFEGALERYYARKAMRLSGS